MMKPQQVASLWLGDGVRVINISGSWETNGSSNAILFALLLLFRFSKLAHAIGAALPQTTWDHHRAQHSVLKKQYWKPSILIIAMVFILVFTRCFVACDCFKNCCGMETALKPRGRLWRCWQTEQATLSTCVVWEMAHAGARPRCVAACDLLLFWKRRHHMLSNKSPARVGAINYQHLFVGISFCYALCVLLSNQQALFW